MPPFLPFVILGSLLPKNLSSHDVDKLSPHDVIDFIFFERLILRLRAIAIRGSCIESIGVAAQEF